MGYDIYWKDEPAELAALDTEPTETPDGGWKYPDGYFEKRAEIQDRYRSYWRESIFSMSGFRSVLEACDAVVVEEIDFLSNDPDVPDETEVPGIHRFGSNDGWWVTADQCLEMAKRIDEVYSREGGPLYLGHVKANGISSTSWERNAVASLMGAIGGMGDDVSVAIGASPEAERAADEVRGMIKFFRQAGLHGNGIVVW